MKPSEKNFERLLKRIVKDEKVSEQDLLFHWLGLGKAGDRALIHVLNRTTGWKAFLSWAKEFDEVKEQLSVIAKSPGISDEVISEFAAAGVRIPEEDENRKRASWILSVVERNLEEEWGRAREMLNRDPELLDGVLSLFEQSESPSVLLFLKDLADENRLEEQDRQIRKAMYRMKQRLPPAEEAPQSVSQRELFSFAENRLPLSQLLFYFRPHSAFSPKGDVYFLSFVEGQSFESSQRGKDMEIDLAWMERITSQYAERLKSEYRIETNFHPMPSSQARYFLIKSLQLLGGKPAEARLNEFLRFIGSEPNENPIPNFAKLNPASAAEIFHHPYFAAWMIPQDSLGDFFQNFQNLKDGPIILPEAQLKQREHSEKLSAIVSYFNHEKRAVWSLAFEKAAYFLQRSDPRIATGCVVIAQQFGDAEVEPANVDAAVLLLERTLQYYLEQQRLREQEDKKGSLIMSPEEFARRSSKPDR